MSWKNVSYCHGFLQSKYRIQEDSSYEKGAYALQWNFCWCARRHGAEDMSKEDLRSLERKARYFKIMLVETFDEHRDFDLYKLQYYLFHYGVKDIERVGTFSILKAGSCELFNFHISSKYRRALQRRLTRMTEKVNVREGRYERLLSYRNREDDRKLEQSDERMTRSRQSALYVVRNGITKYNRRNGTWWWCGFAQKLDSQHFVRIAGNV